jgi:cytochrome P450
MMDTRKQSLEHGVSEDKTFEQMKKDGLSDEDIVINGIILLAAGYETTSSLLSMATHCLAAYPECQDRLTAEIDEAIGQKQDSITYDKILNMEYLDMFLQETLRMYPPAGRFNRQPNVDIEIKGLLFRKGEDITFSTHSLHRNPLYWPEPDKFNPERFAPQNKDNIVPYSFIPFGAGPRNCVGMKLALVEVKMALVRLLQYTQVARCPGFKIPPEIDVKGGILRPKDGLRVKLVRR